MTSRVIAMWSCLHVFYTPAKADREVMQARTGYGSVIEWLWKTFGGPGELYRRLLSPLLTTAETPDKRFRFSNGVLHFPDQLINVLTDPPQLAFQ